MLGSSLAKNFANLLDISLLNENILDITDLTHADYAISKVLFYQSEVE